MGMSEGICHLMHQTLLCLKAGLGTHRYDIDEQAGGLEILDQNEAHQLHWLDSALQGHELVPLEDKRALSSVYMGSRVP